MVAKCNDSDKPHQCMWQIPVIAETKHWNIIAVGTPNRLSDNDKGTACPLNHSTAAFLHWPGLEKFYSLKNFTKIVSHARETANCRTLGQLDSHMHTKNYL